MNSSFVYFNEPKGEKRLTIYGNDDGGTVPPGNCGKGSVLLSLAVSEEKKIAVPYLYIQISQSATKHSFPYLDDDVAQAETKHVIY